MDIAQQAGHILATTGKTAPLRQGSFSEGMYGTSMRENRESPCPPAWLVSGRAAQGTPRR